MQQKQEMSSGLVLVPTYAPKNPKHQQTAELENFNPESGGNSEFWQICWML